MFKKIKKLKVKVLSVGIASILLFGSVGANVYADNNVSDYKKVDSIVRTQDFKRGKLTMKEYADVIKMMQKLPEDDYKKALELRVNAVMKKHNLDVDEVLSSGKDHLALITGYNDGTIKPNNAITREEAAAIITRAKPTKVQNTFATFKDVNGLWSERYINSINVSGYKDGSFRPKTNITRAEALALIDNNFDISTQGNSGLYYSDVENHWAKGLIYKMSSSGVISGYKDGTFKPDKNITRAEFITMINNATRESCKIKNTNPEYSKALNKYNKEIGEHWAKEALIEALIPHDIGE